MRLFFFGYVMANPQKENGFTPIANEIMEALMKVNLSAFTLDTHKCFWYKVGIRTWYG